MKKAPRSLALVVAGLGVLANVPAMVFGLHLFYEWILIHVSDGPYFQYAYLTNALPWLVLSITGMIAAGIAISKPSSYDIFPVSSLIIGLLCTIALPEWGSQRKLAEATTKVLGHADRSLSDWDDAHGRFPSDERELREALAASPLSEPPIFFRNGKPIPYTIRLATNATAPSLEPLPSDPGTVVYAVSSDQKEYWLVVTTLRSPVGGPVVVHHIAGEYDPGKVLVMNRKHHNPGEGYQPFIE